MKVARIALRNAAPLAGAGAGSSSGRLPQEVEQFSRFSPSPLSMKQLLDFGEGREERGEAEAGGQPKPGAQRLVSPRRGEPGGCRGRGARAALCGTQEAAIPARRGPCSASAEVAAAQRQGEGGSCPAGYSQPDWESAGPGVVAAAERSPRPAARGWRPVNAAIRVEDALQHSFGGVRRVRALVHGLRGVFVLRARGVGRSHQAERTRCSQIHYRLGSSGGCALMILPRTSPRTTSCLQRPECFLGDCN